MRLQKPADSSSYQSAIMSLLSALRPKTSSACATLLLMSLISCTNGQSVLAPDASLQVGAVAQASAAPILYQPGRYAKLIDERGGTINFAIGEVYFPPGALEARTVITADVDGRTMGVVLGPSGVTFPINAQPILRFGPMPPRRVPRILYVDSDDVILEILPARIRGRSGLEANLSHFSKYIFGVE